MNRLSKQQIQGSISSSRLMLTQGRNEICHSVKEKRNRVDRFPSYRNIIACNVEMLYLSAAHGIFPISYLET